MKTEIILLILMMASFAKADIAEDAGDLAKKSGLSSSCADCSLFGW